MLRKAATLIAVLVTAISGAAFAGSPAKAETAGKKPATLGQALNTLHAVSQWSMELSDKADTKAKSELVKEYAREMAKANSEKDAKIMEFAKKYGIEVAPLDPKTDEGKSLLERIKAENALLDSLEGDAFDKEYMTLVTNTQQSVLNLVSAQKAAAKDADVKAFMGDMMTVVQARLKKAQDILAKVYGDSV